MSIYIFLKKTLTRNRDRLIFSIFSKLSRLIFNVLFITSYRLMDGYKKMHKFVEVISYFSLQSWTFRDNNTRSLLKKMSKQDKSLFHFDIAKLDWNDYFHRHVRGIRNYIIHDSIDTLPEGRKHMQRLVLNYYICNLFKKNMGII